MTRAETPVTASNPPASAASPPAVPRRLVALHVAANLIVALMATAVFSGVTAIPKLAPIFVVCLGLSVIHRLAEQRSETRWVSRLAVVLLVVVYLGALAFVHHRVGLVPFTAAHATLPFLVFVAVVARGSLEYVFFYGVAVVSFIAGAVKTPQGAAFPLVLLVLAMALALSLVVGLLVFDVRRTRRRSRTLARSAPMPVGGGAFVWSALPLALPALAVMLLLAAGAFVVLPRPAPGATRPAPEPTTTRAPAGGQPTGLTPDRLPMPPAPIAPRSASAALLPDRVRLKEFGRILRNPTRIARVRFIDFRGVGRHRRQDAFYVRARVYDTYTQGGWTAAAGEAIQPLVALPGGLARLDPLSTILRNHPATRANLVAAVARTPSEQRFFTQHVRLLTPEPAVLTPLWPVTLISVTESALEANWSPGRMAGVLRGAPPKGYALSGLDLPRLGLLGFVTGLPSDPRLANGRYVALPAALDENIKVLGDYLVLQASRGADDLDGFDRRAALDVARAFTRFLKSERFRYTLVRQRSVRYPRDPLAAFLFESRAGHCELFATALCVLLRTQGIAARVVGGYRGGTWIPDAPGARTGEYLLRGLNAHLWVEFYCRGFGWFPWDPTPGRPRRTELARMTELAERGQDPGSLYREPAAPPAGPVLTPGATPSPGATPQADSEAPDTAGPARDEPAVPADNVVAGFTAGEQARLWDGVSATADDLEAGIDRGFTTVLFFLPAAVARSGLTQALSLLAFALGLVLLVRHRRTPPCAKQAQPRPPRPRAAELLLPWIHELERALVSLGYRRAPATTWRVFAAHVMLQGGERFAPLSRIVSTYELARYGECELPEVAEQALAEDVAGITALAQEAAKSPATPASPRRPAGMRRNEPRA